MFFMKEETSIYQSGTFERLSENSLEEIRRQYFSGFGDALPKSSEINELNYNKNTLTELYPELLQLDQNSIVPNFDLYSPEGEYALTPIRMDEIRNTILATVQSDQQVTGQLRQQRPQIREKDKLPIRALRDSAPLRALTQIARTDFWSSVAPVIGRRDEFRQDTEAPGRRNRILAPLFAGISKAKPELVDAALDIDQDAKNQRLLENIKAGKTRADEIVIGAGVHAAIWTAEGDDTSNSSLVLEARKKTGGIFGIAERATFRLNSRTRAKNIKKEGVPGKPGSLNDLGDGVVQPSDLTGDVYQPNDEIARAIRTNLALQADVLTSARATGFKRVVRPSQDKPGRFEVQFVTEDGKDTYTLYTDRLVIASGLATERSYGTIEFADAESKKIFDEELDKADRGESSLIHTHDTFNKRTGNPSVQFPFEEFNEKTVGVTGIGDSSKTDIDLLTGNGPTSSGSVRQIDAVEEIVWFGQTNATKEAYLNESRVRYSTIGLELPREGRPDYISRIETAPALRKVSARRTDDGRLTINGQTLDYLLLDTGYINTTDELLADFATTEYPLDIDVLSAKQITDAVTGGGSIDFTPGLVYKSIRVFGDSSDASASINVELTDSDDNIEYRQLTKVELINLCDPSIIDCAVSYTNSGIKSEFETIPISELPNSKKELRKLEVASNGLIITDGDRTYRVVVVSDYYNGQRIELQRLQAGDPYSFSNSNQPRTITDNFYETADFKNSLNFLDTKKQRIYSGVYMPNINKDKMIGTKIPADVVLDDIAPGMIFTAKKEIVAVVGINPTTQRVLTVTSSTVDGTSKVTDLKQSTVLNKAKKASTVTFYKNPYDRPDTPKISRQKPELKKEDVLDPLTGEVIGKKVLGEEIYYVGPAAGVDLAPEEIEEYGGIFDNTQAIFATGPRTRKLKRLLGKVKPSVRNVQSNNVTKTDLRRPVFVDKSDITQFSLLAEVTDSDLERIPFDADIPQLLRLALSKPFENKTIPSFAESNKEKFAMTFEYGADGEIIVNHTLLSLNTIRAITEDQRLSAYARELLRRGKLANPNATVGIGIEVCITPLGYSAGDTAVELLVRPNEDRETSGRKVVSRAIRQSAIARAKLGRLTVQS